MASSPDRFQWTTGGDPTLRHKRKIAAGLTGVVHELYDIPKGRAFARKVIDLGGWLAKPEIIENETRAIKKLCSGSHPNIVEVLRIGELKDSPYYFIDMELCDINLQDYIYRDDSKPLPDAIPYFIKDASAQVKALQIWNIIKQIASGVAFIHSHHETHRDIKPQNILYSRKDSEWKIADFGLTSEGGSKTFLASQLGRGTESYRAPELVTQKEYNNTVDIWAIGCILYELATFKKAFSNDFEVYEYSKGQISFEIVLDGFDEASATSMEELILRILKVEPNDRPSAGELVKEFKKLAEAESPGNTAYVQIHQDFQRIESRTSTLTTLSSDFHGFMPQSASVGSEPSVQSTASDTHNSQVVIDPSLAEEEIAGLWVDPTSVFPIVPTSGTLSSTNLRAELQHPSLEVLNLNNAFQLGTDGPNVRHYARRPEVPPDWKLDSIQVNIQNTLMAIVTNSYRRSEMSYVTTLRCQLWDVSSPKSNPIWTTESSISPVDIVGLPKPAFDPNGRFVCFAMGIHLLNIYSTSTTIRQITHDKLVMPRVLRTVQTPGRISVVAIGFGLDVPERMATAEPFGGQPRLRQEHWEGGMKVDIVAESEQLDQDVLCYDKSGQYLFHMYVEKGTSRYLSISRFTLITGDRFQYARIRDFVMEIHNAIPIVSKEKEGWFLALYVTYQGFRDVVGTMFHKDPLKSRQVLIAHLENRSVKKFKMEDGVYVSLTSSEIVLYNPSAGILGIWTPDMRSGPVTVVRCQPISKGRIRWHSGVAMAVNLAGGKFALYSPEMGLISLVLPRFALKDSTTPFPKPIDKFDWLLAASDTGADLQWQRWAGMGE